MLHALICYVCSSLACTQEVSPLLGAGDAGDAVAVLDSGPPMSDAGGGDADMDAGDAEVGVDVWPCDGPWRTRFFPGAPTATVADFLLEGAERLFLDLEVGGQGPGGRNVGVDVIELESGIRAPHLRGQDGIVRLVASGGGRQCRLRYDRYAQVATWTFEALTQGSWVGFTGIENLAAYGHQHGWAQEGFVAVLLTELPGESGGGLVWKGRTAGENVHSNRPMDRFEVDGPRAAALMHRFDDWSIQVFDVGALHEPVWIHILAGRPPWVAATGPWLSGETVLFREGSRSYTYTLGEPAPEVVMEDPVCFPLDLKDGAAIFGCEPVPDAPVRAYRSLRYRRGAEDRRLPGIAGVITEVHLVDAEQLVWREWDEAADLCWGRRAQVGRVKVLDVLGAAPARVLGTAQAPCTCCGLSVAPMRLTVAEGVVAWSHGPPHDPGGPTTVGVADRDCR